MTFDIYHRSALLRLERAEVEIAVIASNTPHERLEEIARGTRIRIVDLFEESCARAARQEARRFLILGTGMTMTSRRLHRLLESRGIEPVLPGSFAARGLEELIGDLERGAAANAWPRLAAIARECLGRSRPGDVIGLHCTELPLALPDNGRLAAFQYAGMQFLNPSIVHVEAALGLAGHRPRPARATPGRTGANRFRIGFR